MGIKIGVCGAGPFANRFIPLFQAHPLVDEVCLAEMSAERRDQFATKFGLNRTYQSLDELCASDVDAVGVFTQRWLHGSHALQALQSGKHVFSAVPAAITVEEIAGLVDAVKQSGLTYMLGETSYYAPPAIYCRERFARGDFGRFVYGEGEYWHDMSDMYGAYEGSNSDDWRQYASFPPMYYATHSVGMVLSVTGTYMTHVACFGFEDTHPDGIFRRELSHWQNTFSNESALFRTSDGGSCRINELRRIGMSGGLGERISIYGTEASYEEQANAQVWLTKQPDEMIDLTELFACNHELADLLAGTVAQPGAGPASRRPVQELMNDWAVGLSLVHPVQRLPREFIGKPNGHHGSHQFLVVDFVEAVAHGTLPPLNVWTAARYTTPGIVAHASAVQGGDLLPIPDFGDPPA